MVEPDDILDKIRRPLCPQPPTPGLIYPKRPDIQPIEPYSPPQENNSEQAKAPHDRNNEAISLTHRI